VVRNQRIMLRLFRTQLINTNNSVQGTRLGLEALGYKKEVVNGSPVAKPSSTGYRPPQKKSEPFKPKVAKQKESKPAKPRIDPVKAKRESY